MGKTKGPNGARREESEPDPARLRQKRARGAFDAAIPWPTLAIAVLAFAAGFGAKGGTQGPDPATKGQPSRVPTRQPSSTPAVVSEVSVKVAGAGLASGAADPPTWATDGAAGAGAFGGELVASGGMGRRVGAKLEARLEGLLQGTFTDACKQQVGSSRKEEGARGRWASARRSATV
jgi:hypothetical protein